MNEYQRVKKSQQVSFETLNDPQGEKRLSKSLHFWGSVGVTKVNRSGITYHQLNLKRRPKERSGLHKKKIKRQEVLHTKKQEKANPGYLTNV